ncbi:MAG: hypothetical protein ACK4V2_00840 [Pseudomonadota bacterium]|jgi:hypothetical protein|nr:YybS family protein [Alphaproteobacteria bacterium]
MAKNDLRLIIQGGALSAAFSFMVFFNPILGSITSFFALLPIFYVGLCLGIRAFLFSCLIPLTGYLILLGFAGVIVFMFSLFLPTFIILHWHFFKEKNNYKFSSMDIVHKLSFYSLGLITLGFAYLKYTNSSIFEGLTKKIEVANSLAKMPLVSSSIIEILPGVLSFFGLLMIWLNFQTAYAFALRTHKAIRKPTKKQNIFLPPVWDIAFVASLWLIIANQLFIESFLLNIFSRTVTCICAFPLLIDGLETIQLIAKAHKLPALSIVIFIMLTFLLVWPMIFIVMLGLIEPLCGIKKKYYSKFN